MSSDPAGVAPAPSYAPQALAQPVAGSDFVVEAEIAFGDVVLPDTVDRVGSMISPSEKRLLHRLARDHYTGAGSIIDAGTFLGASTAALASGVVANRRGVAIVEAFRQRGDRPLWGYDRGSLQETTEPDVEKTMRFGDTTVVLGESYEPVLRHNLAPFGDVTELILGDFLRQAWPAGKPIEICFIDLAKTQALNRHVVRNFFPALIPGRSIVIQQDFFFDRLPWIKVLMGHFADRFQWLGQVGASSIYRCTGPFTAAMCASAPYLDLSPEVCVAAHRSAEHPDLSRRRRFSLAISLGYLYGHRLGLTAANAHLDRVETEFADILASAVKGPMTARDRIARARRRLPDEIRRLQIRRRP